jgi:hypothetical protein
VLKRARLVTDRAAGTRRVYALNPEAFESLRSYFDQFWGQALAAFKKRIDEENSGLKPATPHRERGNKGE